MVAYDSEEQHHMGQREEWGEYDVADYVNVYGTGNQSRYLDSSANPITQFGTLRSPFWTFTTAVIRQGGAYPFDTLWINAGDYAFTGTIASPMTLRAYPGTVARIGT